MSDANSFFGSRPSFHVEGQEEAALATHLIALVISEGVDAPPRCEATFDNWEARALTYPSGGSIVLGGPLEVRLGAVVLFQGQIEALEGRFPAAWPPELRVRAVGRVSETATHTQALRLSHGAALREAFVTTEQGARLGRAALPSHRAAHERTVARGLTAPTVGLRVGVRVELTGIGTSFGGTYQVTETRHLFDLAQGLRTEFGATRVEPG